MLCRLASGGGLRAPRLPARACAGTWQQRCNATTDPSPPPSPKPAAKGVAALLLQTGADAVLRGVGQVVFCNSPAKERVKLQSLAGVGMLAALGLGGGPALLFGAGAGTAVATASSALCGLDASARAAGLHGYALHKQHSALEYALH
ncbi:hypothetical protein T492DRAFT_895935 [Pavlovales sp. CCMP2436]|nr:hypothetical protein T492DRAFT_895935 [Pavlovales sp. CCMP2436]